MTERRTHARLGEAAFGLGVFLLGVFVAVMTTNIRVGPTYSFVGPRVFPWLIAGALCLVGIALLAESLTATAPSPRPQVDRRAIALVGLGLAGQLALMTTAGFIIASTVLFVAVAAAFDSRRHVLNTAIGLALTAVTQVVFTWGLGLRLPAGIFAGLL